ncbi:ornithine cyclodeaminase family protein [Phyllobacterium sp. LjRoot231]|uniref:ornithine cyclodeaminase family protein n=1 Tax=Phyllobacterium sp. LjRoot231 TaxID=3342289 RepID=UPI003ED0CC57
MTLLLSNEDAAEVLTMSNTLDALEELYRDLGTGSAVYRGRTDLFAPTVAEIGADIPAAHQFKTLDGAIPRLEVASIRVTSDVVAFPEVNGLRRRIKIPAATGKSYVGLVFLFSSATGELISIIQDGILQRFTVGAINAIGAKYLSRRDSSVVGLIGAGSQAGPQLAALKQVRPIRHVRVYSPTAGEADSFATKMSELLGIEVTVAESAEAAVTDVDIAVTATNSRVPFFPAAWLKPGMHLSCMQRDEPNSDCFKEADVVVFHTRMKEHEYVSTDFAETEKRFNFVMRDHPPRDLDWNDFPDLGELVAGKIKGRQNPQERTFFLNSTGVGAQFTALAHLIYNGSRKLGLGYEVPAEFFVESIQP